MLNGIIFFILSEISENSGIKTFIMEKHWWIKFAVEKTALKWVGEERKLRKVLLIQETY